MPTPISHAVVGFAIAAWTQRGAPSLRVSAVAAACAALPDIDFFGWPFAHRGITHSVAFALVSAVLATIVFFRAEQWTQRRIALVVGLALLSHSCLDALSTYSFGVAFLSPFSEQRFRFLWTPLGDSNGTLTAQLVQEAIFVLAPAIVAGWLGFRFKSRDAPKAAPA